MEHRSLKSIPRQESFVEAPVPNPFENNMKLTRWEKLHVFLASITLVPIRAFFMTVFLLLTWPVAFIATYGMEETLGKVPLTGWRRELRGPLRRFLKAVLWASGIPIRTKRIIGKRAHPSVAPILVAAPHASMWDGCAACLGCGLPSFVAARFNKDLWIIGRLIEFLQPVYVTREDPKSRQNTIKEIIRRTHSGGQWPQIVIFPEGTTTNGRALITFKPGAFIPAVPVQPVLIRYPNKLDTVTWTWEGPGAWKLLWLTLCQVHTRVEVEFLPVYTPSEDEKENPKLYAANVRKVMADALGIPFTDHTYDDCRLMVESLKKNLPQRTGLVEFSKLQGKLGLSWNQVSLSLDKFAQIARNRDGKIGIEEFADYLGLPVSPALKEVFDMYDRSKSGEIDFREYVIGLSLVIQPANSDETLKRAFEIFDQENKGYITFGQGKHILEAAFEMSEEEVSSLFHKIDKNHAGKIYYEDFAAYIREKPEYAKLFLTYVRLQEEEEEAELLARGEGKGAEEEGKGVAELKKNETLEVHFSGVDDGGEASAATVEESAAVVLTADEKAAAVETDVVETVEDVVETLDASAAVVETLGENASGSLEGTDRAEKEKETISLEQKKTL